MDMKAATTIPRSIRIPPWMDKAIAERMKANKRSYTREVEALLEQALDGHHLDTEAGQAKELAEAIKAAR